MAAPSIILKNVSVQQYGKTVLDGINFELSGNHHLAITGISGSGKTSLAKALAGKLFHKGSIEINYSSNKSLQAKIVFVSHSEVLKNLSNISDFYYQQRFNSCDAEDAVTVEGELNNAASHLPAEQKSVTIRQWMELLNIVHRKGTPLIQLSNGEQKKLQLIKALLQQPQVLILDKAFTGLDISSRQQLHNIINQQAAKGTTIILITDDKELPSCITHVAELNGGKLSSFIIKEEFFAQQKTATHTRPFNHTAIPAVMPLKQSFNTIVRMNDVTVKYGDKAILQNINWQVQNGERWLVKGHNGAGKSTLLSLVTGDNPQAYSNEIYLFDQRRGKGESIWDIKQKIGYVSPELHKYFDSNITIAQSIASGFFDTMGLYKQLNSTQQIILNKWMDYFELTAFKNHPLSFLSAGQQRWALLARAFVKNPPLLVLDEPCQGLDADHTQQFNRLTDTICNQSNTTLIYVSHYDDEIPACITKKLELDQGRQIIKTKMKEVIAA